MARHRLLDVKRSRTAHCRVGPTGLLYQAFWATIWLTPSHGWPGPESQRLAELIVPAQSYDWIPNVVQSGPRLCVKCRRPTDTGGTLCGICKFEPTAL